MQIERPSSLDQALRLLAERRYRLLAGGTDLLVGFDEGGGSGGGGGAAGSRSVGDRAIANGEGLAGGELTWLDLGGLAELCSLREEGGELRIGAGVTHDEIERSPLLRRAAEVLCQAAASVGSPQIRNRATLGGNLANASPAADLVPALCCLDAELVLASTARGRRLLPVAEFTLGPRRTCLQPDELIVEARFAPRPDSMHGFEKLGQRNALAIAIVSLAAVARRNAQGGLAEVAIALGSVAPTVIRAPRTEELLRSRPLDEALVAAAVEQVQLECSPISDIRASAEYRRAMVGELLRRFLGRLLFELT